MSGKEEKALSPRLTEPQQEEQKEAEATGLGENTKLLTDAFNF